MRSAVNEYDGELRWTLQSREREGLPGVIWSIMPEEVFSKRKSLGDEFFNINEYFSKNLPSFGPVAYRDLDGLMKHVEQYFFGEAK